MKESGEIITSSYCKDNGIPTLYLNRLEKSGLLFKIEKGLYLNNEANFDDYYFFQYRFKKTIYSYETALFLQGLTDRLPLVKDVSVPYNYKFNDLITNINVYYVNKNIFEIAQKMKIEKAVREVMEIAYEENGVNKKVP